MSIPLAQYAQPFNFDRLQQTVVVNGAIGRLLVACLLGAVVGLQREIKRKAADGFDGKMEAAIAEARSYDRRAPIVLQL